MNGKAREQQDPDRCPMPLAATAPVYPACALPEAIAHVPQADWPMHAAGATGMQPERAAAMAGRRSTVGEEQRRKMMVTGATGVTTGTSRAGRVRRLGGETEVRTGGGMGAAEAGTMLARSRRRASGIEMMTMRPGKSTNTGTGTGTGTGINTEAGTGVGAGTEAGRRATEAGTGIEAGRRATSPSMATGIGDTVVTLSWNVARPSLAVLVSTHTATSCGRCSGWHQTDGTPEHSPGVSCRSCVAQTLKDDAEVCRIAC